MTTATTSLRRSRSRWCALHAPTTRFLASLHRPVCLTGVRRLPQDRCAKHVRPLTQAQWFHSLTITCLCRRVCRSPREVRKLRSATATMRTLTRVPQCTGVGTSWRPCPGTLSTLHLPPPPGLCRALTISPTFTDGCPPRRSRRCASACSNSAQSPNRPARYTTP